MKKRTSFQTELEDIINRYSMENGSDTPDWILAEYLVDCLDAFNRVCTKREKWYGRGPKYIPDNAPNAPGGSPS